MTRTPEASPMDPDDDDMIAAEYVVGTLDLFERLAAEARIKRDPDFAALVDSWQNRLADLNEDYAEAPAPNLLPQIEARLFPVAPRKPWFARFWAVAGSVAVAVLVAGYFLMVPPQPSMVATLVADASPLRYEATIAGDDLVLTLVAGAAAEAADPGSV